MKKKLLIALLAASSISTAYAANLPSYEMQEIIVTEEKIQNAVSKDTIDIKYVSPGKITSIPELLRQTTGIDIKHRTSYGDNQDDTVKIRGLDAKRYTVLLDGQPINMSAVMGGNYIDWNSIPINNVEKIQIIKGSKLASSGNVGGTINIITKKNATGGYLSTMFGENGRQEHRLNYAFTTGKLHTQLDVNKTAMDAFIKNNDYDAHQYGVKFSYDFSKVDNLQLGYQKTHAERGYALPNKKGEPTYNPLYPESIGDGLIQPQPGPIGQSGKYGLGSYWQKDSEQYFLNYKHTFKEGYLQFSYLKNKEERREILKNTAGKTQLDRVIPSDQSDYFGLKGESTVHPKHLLGYGTSLKRLRYGYGYYNVRPQFAGELYPSQKIDQLDAYIDDKWSMDDRWQMYLGLRYDHITAGKDDPRAVKMVDYKKGSISPKFSLSLKSDPKNTTYLSINKVWRAPSMPEFYWWSNSALNQKQYLKPEHGISYELSTIHKFDKRYDLKIGAFYENISDYINFRHYSPFLVYNIDNVKIWGLELESKIKFDDKNNILINYTHQRSKKSGSRINDLQNGLPNELDYMPKNKLGISYIYDDKLWNLRYTLNCISDQKESPVATGGSVVKIGGYAVHNIAITRNITNNSSLSLLIDNIFDKQYSEQYGYPKIGRQFGVNYILRF